MIKKHTTVAPKTLKELKKHLEKECCYPIVTRELFLELIYRLEDLEWIIDADL